MLMLLSPAKIMNFDAAPGAPAATKPMLAKETAEIAAAAKKLKKADLRKLMRISDQLAELNYERFQAFDPGGDAPGAKQAALTFAGDVYRGLDAGSLTPADLAFAQDRLRILSGLYGLLRPLDAIQPYRLEMGSRLKTKRSATLHGYWGPVLAAEIDRAASALGDPVVACLASNEYAGAIDRKALKSRFVAFNFKEEKDGKTRAVMLFVKQARGMMARWAIENRLTRIEDLKTFNVGGYRFSPAHSTGADWVFVRPQPAPKAAARKPAASKAGGKSPPASRPEQRP